MFITPLDGGISCHISWTRNFFILFNTTSKMESPQQSLSFVNTSPSLALTICCKENSHPSSTTQIWRYSSWQVTQWRNSVAWRASSRPKDTTPGIYLFGSKLGDGWQHLQRVVLFLEFLHFCLEFFTLCHWQKENKGKLLDVKKNSFRFVLLYCLKVSLVFS